MASFSAGDSSAFVRASPSATKIGSYPNPPVPRGDRTSLRGFHNDLDVACRPYLAASAAP